ncbi:MAG: DUF2235 domain-containing protein [Verrucomicrobiales bacterium]|nr:DUF2235 domain-containing protein [Verrucomicrobiales bacterium]
MKKRLIVCSDGTWQNLEAPYPTNVVKTTIAISPEDNAGVPQMVFYDEGVGGNSSRFKFLKYPAGAFGWGIDLNIQECYRFLSANYEPGDEIYLFGFSRGAYTVRSLAGLLYVIGLVSRENIRLSSLAYQAYRKSEGEREHERARAFREEHGENLHEPIVNFLGCWDTVKSLGAPDLVPWIYIDQFLNEGTFYHNDRISPIIEYAAHALSIDEKRRFFPVKRMEKHERGDDSQVTEVWFPGDHGGIGGGSRAKAPLSDITLDWMFNFIDNNPHLHLKVDRDRLRGDLKIRKDPTIPASFKPATFWTAFGLLKRQPKDEGEAFHTAVNARWCSEALNYRPENLMAYSGEFDDSCPVA